MSLIAAMKKHKRLKDRLKKLRHKKVEKLPIYIAVPSIIGRRRDDA
jgi:hypothetical protein